ncbi:MAG TPA: Fur family transcriptional regulator [Pirellulales bacterium]|nr:Fur family transcriptional regulator [Pirellulales bacterium]
MATMSRRSNREIVLRPATERRLRAALDKAALRYTAQRAMTFACLERLDCHPTAEEVYLSVRQRLPRISLATVYKALDALAEAGLIAKLAGEDGRGRYDCRGTDHYHLRDTRTGEVKDLATPFDPDLLAKLDPRLVDRLTRAGFQVSGYRLEVLGTFAPADEPG